MIAKYFSIIVKIVLLIQNRKCDFLKKDILNWPLFGLSFLIIGTLLMIYLRQVYFVGLIVSFILIAFQTPSPYVDKTGEANDFNLALLKVIGASTIAYLIGGYVALLFF